MPDSAVSIQGTPSTGMFAVGIPSCDVFVSLALMQERLFWDFFKKRNFYFEVLGEDVGH